MNIIDIKGLKIIKEIPLDTKIMVGWHAIWRPYIRRNISLYGYSPKRTYPILVNGELVMPDNFVQSLTNPNAIPLITLELRTLGSAQRSNKRNFNSSKNIIVVKYDGSAWLISDQQEWNMIINSAQSKKALDNANSFDIELLIGADEFRDVLSKFKLIIKKWK